MHKSVPSKTGAKTSAKAPTHVARDNTLGSSRHCTLSEIVVVLVVVVAFLLPFARPSACDRLRLRLRSTHTHSHWLTDGEQAELGATKPKPETPAENLALLFKFLCNLELFVSCVSEFAATVCREESSEILLCTERLYTDRVAYQSVENLL